MTFQSTGALLREVARLHVQLQRTCVAECCGTTTMQCTVLTELGRSGPMTLAELARRIGFDKSWTSRAVEHLVQEGLVEKVGSTQDRRTVRLSLSPPGEACLADLNHTLGALWLTKHLNIFLPTSTLPFAHHWSCSNEHCSRSRMRRPHTRKEERQHAGAASDRN